jgi:hypothetical protein
VATSSTIGEGDQWRSPTFSINATYGRIMLGRALALLLFFSVLAAPTTPTTPASAEPDEPRRAARAEAALSRVEAVLEERAGGSATMALRDLALLKDALPAEQQARAASYLSRPTANPDRCPDYSCYRTRRVKRVCFSVVCVHYVLRSDDRKNGVPPRDTDSDGRPDYVEHVLQSVTRVHRTYVDAGYRPPVHDGRRGGDVRPDIYLAQIGNRGLYGYCTTDAAQVPAHGSTWAYCVLDNDYARTEFPTHTPIENMHVTAAHEYFHAVQFGYDVGEDPWFMEATATWVEDEVYDRVNDNVAYLRQGPIGRPATPLDSRRGGYYYGAWIYFRHVTERFRRSQAGLPVIVRRMWRLADAGSAGAPNLYSMAAVQHALAENGSSVGKQLLTMAAANLHPRRWYDEGRRYPAAEVRRTFTLTRAAPRKTLGFEQDHLTSASYRFEPAALMTADDWRLRLSLDLAPEQQASQALARVMLRSGRARTVMLELSPAGDYEGSVLFSAAQVRAVELTVVNGSTRYRCSVGTGWSCRGRPLDQDVAQSVVVKAARG